jgi:hypothetical protein
MHEDFGANAGREPGTDDRAYRIDVLLDRVPEIAGVALLHRIADLLIEEGLASPEGAEARAVVRMHEHTWTPDVGEALHLVIPRAVPRSPDLGLGYNPN